MDSKDSYFILALETSGRFGSVVAGKNDTVFLEKSFSDILRHSAELFGTTRQILSELNAQPRDVKEVYISSGPGSFTGLRIAFAAAKGWHLVNGARVVAANTMDVLAQNALQYIKDKNINSKQACDARVGIIIDAKRGQFFTAVFKYINGQWQRVSEDQMLTAAEFLNSYCGGGPPMWLLGEGLLYYQKLFSHPDVIILPQEYWHARASAVFAVGRKLAKAGQYSNPAGLVPNYLRRPVE